MVVAHQSSVAAKASKLAGKSRSLSLKRSDQQISICVWDYRIDMHTLHGVPLRKMADTCGLRGVFVCVRGVVGGFCGNFVVLYQWLD